MDKKIRTEADVLTDLEEAVRGEPDSSDFLIPVSDARIIIAALQEREDMRSVNVSALIRERLNAMGIDARSGFDGASPAVRLEHRDIRRAHQ